MKVEDITVEFLSENMKNIEIEEIDLTNEIINDLKNTLERFINDYDSNDEEDVETKNKLKQAINKLQNVECRDYEIAYDIYINSPFFNYREDEPMVELYRKVEEQEQYMNRIDELATKFYKVIKNSFSDFGDVGISFSSKSPSVYLELPIKATEENVEMINESIDYNSFLFSVANLYRENESYDNDKNIEIRLSDHDFGGYYKKYGLCEYISYEKDCINIVYRF